MSPLDAGVEISRAEAEEVVCGLKHKGTVFRTVYLLLVAIPTA